MANDRSVESFSYGKAGESVNFAEYIPTISLVIGIALAIRELRKGPSETEARVTGTAVNVLDRVSKRLDDVEKELEELRADNEWLMFGIDILVKQLQELGTVPLWTPRHKRPGDANQHSQDRGELPKQKGQDVSGKNPKRRGF